MTPGAFANHDCFKVFGQSKALNTYKAINKFDYILGKGGNRPDAEDLTLNGLIILLLGLSIDFSSRKAATLSQLLQLENTDGINLFDFLRENFKTNSIYSLSVSTINQHYAVIEKILESDNDEELKLTKNTFSVDANSDLDRTVETSFQFGFLHSVYAAFYRQPIAVWGGIEEYKNQRDKKRIEWERNEPSIQTILNKLKKQLQQ